LTRFVAFLAFLVPALAYAGGGPLNVVVLYNADDADSAETAAYYAEARSILDDHLCGLTGPALGAPTVAFDDFIALVRTPFEACLDTLPEPDLIDYLVLVRGLPYRVDLPDDGYHTSLSAMLQIGRTRHESSNAELAGFDAQGRFRTIQNPFFPHESNPGPGDYTLDNPTAAAYTAATWWTRSDELPETFRRGDASTINRWVMDEQLFVVTRLDGFDHVDARALVDRGVTADGTFPDAELLCMAAADGARGARDPECEYTSRMLSGAGLPATWLADHDATLSGREVAAYFTGAAQLQDAIEQTYVPGAIVDNLTSYGAVPSNWFCTEDGLTCPENESQTSIARFVRAGATGVHGTVAEPFNPVFPNAGTLLLYTGGYNLAESFFFNQRWLYWQNLYVGDPLTTPYAERPRIAVAFDTPGDLGGVHPAGELLSVTAIHPHGVDSITAWAFGVVLDEADGDLLELDLEGYVVGDVVDILVVAVASDARLDRPGWPEASPLFRPRVQGWTTVALTVGPEIVGSDPEEEGCSCNDGTSVAFLLLFPLGRRRRPASSGLCSAGKPFRSN
jgi:hypothetical protein